MTESSPKEIACILLELIRLCNEELLGYLVQCVYQKYYLYKLHIHIISLLIKGCRLSVE